MLTRRQVLKSVPFLSVTGMLFGSEAKRSIGVSALGYRSESRWTGELTFPVTIQPNLDEDKCLSRIREILLADRRTFGVIVCDDPKLAREFEDTLINTCDLFLSRMGEVGINPFVAISADSLGSAILSSGRRTSLFPKHIDWYCIVDRKRTDSYFKIYRKLNSVLTNGSGKLKKEV